jgi:hypothetical protein
MAAEDRTRAQRRDAVDQRRRIRAVRLQALDARGFGERPLRPLAAAARAHAAGRLALRRGALLRARGLAAAFACAPAPKSVV